MVTGAIERIFGHGRREKVRAWMIVSQRGRQLRKGDQDIAVGSSRECPRIVLEV